MEAFYQQHSVWPYYTFQDTIVNEEVVLGL